MKLFWNYFKASIVWIGLGLARLIQYPISLLFFPIAFPFRKRAYEYCRGKHGVDYNLFHPLSIANWFFTKDDDSGNYYTGSYWYKQELKDNVFTEYTDSTKRDPIPITFFQKVVYFYIAYCWCGARNFMWNLQRIMFYGSWNKNREFTILKERLNVEPVDKKVTPQSKFTDDDNDNRNNSGPRILYPNSGHNISLSTIEGVKSIYFNDDKGRFRFQHMYVKIIPFEFINRILSFEFMIGWNYISCSWYMHLKPMIKKLDDKELSNYKRYRREYGK